MNAERLSIPVFDKLFSPSFYFRETRPVGVHNLGLGGDVTRVKSLLQDDSPTLF